MASLYKRKRSAYWWIEYVDASGARRQESTKLRRDVVTQSREARALCEELTRRERERAERGLEPSEEWSAWVPRLISQRYGDSELSLGRYEIAWRNIEAFLRTKAILVPRQLGRQQVRDFIEWRATAHADVGVYKAAKNTALLEIKLLGIIMGEAIESGMATANPCRGLGIKRDEPKIKPEITVDEHRLITRLVKREPEWMRVSYKIAWEQGCRFSETCFPLRDVDLARNVLRLRTKGKKKTQAEVPLRPQLRPLLRRLIRQGREETFQMPRYPAKRWAQFFRRIGLRHLCFHCTRVSFVSRCYRSGLPEETVMRLVLHASTTVHRIYPRLPASSEHLQKAARMIR